MLVYSVKAKKVKAGRWTIYEAKCPLCGKRCAAVVDGGDGIMIGCGHLAGFEEGKLGFKETEKEVQHEA